MRHLCALDEVWMHVCAILVIPIIGIALKTFTSAGLVDAQPFCVDDLLCARNLDLALN